MLRVGSIVLAIFVAGFIMFTFRDNFGWVGQRLKAEALGTPVLQGSETRVPMAIDGHFWVDGSLNGRDVKFLVDSGATYTLLAEPDWRSIELTATEYNLLRFLLSNPRRVLSKSQILDHVWHYDFQGEANVVETYIHYLRKKIDVPPAPPLIHTVRGVGYVLRLPKE